MNTNPASFHIVDLSKGRRLMINMLNLAKEKHSMIGLLEVDVTTVRQFIADHKEKTGETLSFTGYLAYCLAQAVVENKEVQSYLKGYKQMVMYDDVDVGIMVEHREATKRSLMGHVIRCANQKTFREIHDEIRTVQAEPLPANRGLPGWFRTAMLSPAPLYRLFRTVIRWAGRQDPTIVTAMGGTVSITSVGMFGEGHSGWGIFPATEVLGLVVGSIVWKAAVVAGQVVPREILHLTVMFDHEVVDGAPAARFVHRLIELIESGYGLEEQDNPNS
jgi:pyruvate/2-oxoglutarate dehydrogenase complex dihydrolipoamide acyltransferase (E2) component